MGLQQPGVLAKKGLPRLLPLLPADEKNNALYQSYEELSKKEGNVIFGGRLGQYKYYDMDKVIIAALDAVKVEFGN